MSRKRILYFLLAAYIVGNLLLIFIQYNWAGNLNNLIQGNERLVNEFAVSGRLKELERDILSVESRIRGTITTSDTIFIAGVDQQISSIVSTVHQLKKEAINDSSAHFIAQLDRLVHEKLIYSRELLTVFHLRGKEAAESLIATQQGKRITDSIMITARNIELARRRHLASVTSSVDTSGENALHLGIILIASVLISGAFVFWYIINTIRRQNSLIGQLNQSEKKIREAAQVKENFLANMSHEIRTPMNAILGFTNLLQRKKTFDGEARNYVQTIQRSAESLLTIINDILDLSKIEAGMMRIEPAPFSVRSLLHSVETMIRPKAAEKGLQLTTQVDNDVPDHLEGDAIRLTQILVNLVGNAVKFTQQGWVAVSVANEVTSGETIRLGITVADTGIGIEKEKLPAIFERFQQAEDSVTRKYGGTGLGLAIASDLVQLQGGTISVESEVGQGTTFYVCIPYKICPQPVGEMLSVPEAIAPEPRLQGLRVLIVEDNEINQHLLQTILGHWQVACEVAGNGKKAIEMLQANVFDLVLMDIQMPEMDGYTAAQAIRSLLHLQVPIIAMTAHAMAGEREKCLGYGMNGYIAKPVREKQLYELMLQWVKEGEVNGSEKPAVAATANGFRYIRLDYMKEVSAGNVAYEKLVTEQFLELLPTDLQRLQEAWAKQAITDTRQLAHNIKTTVSVMELNPLLQPHLDALEYNELTEAQFQYHFHSLQQLCEKAMQEAQTFYASLA